MCAYYGSVCECVVGGGDSDSLVALECVVVCGESDKSWMKVSCPIVCAVWAAAVAAFLVYSVCVFVCACSLCCRVFAPSPPLHPWESVTGVPSIAAAAETGLRGRRRTAGCSYLPQGAAAQNASCLWNQPLTTSFLMRRNFEQQQQKKKSKECRELITTLTWQSTRQITSIRPGKYSVSAAPEEGKSQHTSLRSTQLRPRVALWKRSE